MEQINRVIDELMETTMDSEPKVTGLYTRNLANIAKLTQKLQQAEAAKIVPAMTVGQLIDCLRRIPRDRIVWVTFAKEDERKATCVTIDRYGVRICDDSSEVSVSETVLLDTTSED